MKILVLSLNILGLLFSCQLWAMDVWVLPSEPLSSAKLESLIKDLPVDLLQNETHPYIDTQLQNPMPPTQREDLSQLMVKAEGESLRGDFPAAIQIFEQILILMKKYPNTLGLHKITLTALIKTAELYGLVKDPVKESLFWKRAFAWDPQAELNPEIFSPRTIKKFKIIQKANLAEAKAAVRVQAPKSSQVFLDGRKFSEPSGKAKVYPGFHQWAVLIPGSPWQVENFQTQNVSGDSKRDKFVSYVFKPDAYLYGDCEAPGVSKKLSLPEHARLLAAYDAGKCLRVYDGEAWFDIKGSPMVTTQKNDNENSKRLTQSLKTDLTKPSNSITKSPWFWIGVGAVVGGAVLLIKQHDSATPVIPSDTHN